MRSLSKFPIFLANSSALDLYLKPQPLPASFQSIPTHGGVVKRNRAYSAAAKWAPFRARRGSGSRRWRQLERPSRLWVALTCINWVGHIEDGECIYNETYYSGTEALGGACRAASQEQGPASAAKSPMGSELSTNGPKCSPTMWARTLDHSSVVLGPLGTCLQYLAPALGMQPGTSTQGLGT